MKNHSELTAQQPPRFSIERKLLFILFLTAIVPIMILIAGIVIRGFQFEATVAAILFQAIGFGMGYIICSGIVRQSDSINATLARIIGGDFEARAEPITSDELGHAARAINAMCDNTLNLMQSSDAQDQIQNSIENLISEMQAIAAGDLTITSAVNPDITGSIAASVNHMSEQLRSIVERVKSAAEEVTISSTQIRESSDGMSIDSDEQANRIAEASRQLIEMSDSFQQVAELTRESMQVAIEARQTAARGLKAVSDTVDGMNRIRHQVQNTSRRIKHFGESSQEIGEIVQLISDIADQTTILALNASIQASMAGDAGHGFAIVAEEIERLAERSTDATKQISKLIRSIQGETNEIICDMEESTREVVAGSQLAAQAGDKLIEIDAVSSQLVELIQNSSGSVLVQAETASVVAGTMSEISESTKKSAEKSRQATQSVGRLADTVNRLRNSVSQFKVSDRLESLKTPCEPSSKASDGAAGSSLVEKLSRIASDEPRRSAGLPIPPVRTTASPLVQPSAFSQQPSGQSSTSIRTVVKTLVATGNQTVESKPPELDSCGDNALLAKLKAACDAVSQRSSKPSKPPANGNSTSRAENTKMLGDQPGQSADPTPGEGNRIARQPAKTVCKTMTIEDSGNADPDMETSAEEQAIDKKLLQQIREAEAMLKQMQLGGKSSHADEIKNQA